MKKYIIVLLVLVLTGLSCSSPTSKLSDLDLMSKGIPLKLKAPEDADVRTKDMGIFKDITVRKGDSFYLQITGGQKFNENEKAYKVDELSTIKLTSSFSRVIKEDDNGFIYEKKKGDKLTYDFRRIKIQGDEEYLFQTGLIGNFALEDVELMYAATE